LNICIISTVVISERFKIQKNDISEILLKVALNTIGLAPKIQQILFIQLRHKVQHEQPNILTEIQTHIFNTHIIN